IQRRRVLGFQPETLDEMGVSAVLGEQRLHRDRASEHAVFAEEDLGHPTRAELLSQLITVGEDADVVRARTHVSPWTDRRHPSFDPAMGRTGSTPTDLTFPVLTVMSLPSSRLPEPARRAPWRWGLR